MEAVLALADGRAFRGRAFGAPGEVDGEVVFNTSMCGYQEILTDPSYRAQIVTLTCPEIGNVGTNPQDDESFQPQAAGLVVREHVDVPSNWRATRALHEMLREHGVPGISEIDTRALTRHLRSKGAMWGVLSTVDRDVDSLVAKARRATPMVERDVVGEVSTIASRGWSPSARSSSDGPRIRCATLDFGIKRNILNLLDASGFEVELLDAKSSAEDVLSSGADAVFLSNGPGDPTTVSYAIATVRELIGKQPVFGICLGMQLGALALGAKTFKLKFGHRGANHPVRDLRSGRIEITSQNHGYAVDPDSLPSGAEVTHVSLCDGTCEGFVLPDRHFAAVQYHPESSPGPHDARPVFEQFRRMVATALDAAGGRGADGPTGGDR